VAPRAGGCAQARVDDIDRQCSPAPHRSTSRGAARAESRVETSVRTGTGLRCMTFTGCALLDTGWGRIRPGAAPRMHSPVGPPYGLVRDTAPRSSGDCVPVQPAIPHPRPTGQRPPTRGPRCLPLHAPVVKGSSTACTRHPRLHGCATCYRCTRHLLQCPTCPCRPPQRWFPRWNRTRRVVSRGCVAGVSQCNQ
jgi:hypothetical protein